MWLKRIFSQQHGPEPEPEHVKLDTVARLLEELRAKELTALVATGAPIAAEIEATIAKLNNKLDELSSLSINNPDPSMRNIVARARRDLIAKLTSGLQSIKIGKSYEELLALSASLGRFFTVADPGLADFYYTSAVFPQMAGIRADLRALSELAMRLQNCISSVTLELLAKIAADVSIVTRLRQELNQLEVVLSHAESAAHAACAAKERIATELERLRSSEEYAEYLCTVQQQLVLRQNLEHAEMQIRSTLAPITKALKRFEWLQTDKTRARSVQALISSPLEAVLANEQTVLTLLAELRDSIVNGKIELKNKITEKVLVKLSEITAGNLHQLVEQYKVLAAELERLSAKRFPVTERVAELERELALDVGKFEVERARAETAVEQKRVEIEKRRQTIERLCAKVGKPIKLVI